MTARIFIKLILAVTIVLGVALTAVSLLVTPQVRTSLHKTLQRELQEKAHTIELQLPVEQNRFAELGKAVGARVTWIAADGTVLGDSEASPDKMENHGTRPEVIEALAGHTGVSLRMSGTLGVNFYYVAIPISPHVTDPRQHSVLRLAVPVVDEEAQIDVIRNEVLIATILAFLPAVLLAAGFSRYASWKLGRIIDFAQLLTQGNFRTRLNDSGRGELGLLSTRLNETSEKLEFMMARLESEHAELEKLERVRKDFVINVSHELRTPLASIQGYTETLLDGAIHDPNHNVKFLNIIRQNTERLTRLTADLLVLSRVELGQQKFKFASYYVNTLLGDNVDSMRPLTTGKHITLNLDCAPEITSQRAEVFCDAEAVHQILTNLLDNAIKYTPDGGHVTVGARPLGGNGRNGSAPHAEFIEFFVRDTGLGIPPEDLARLFERFYRVDKARSRALGGTGLGLAIVKHLAHAQGGEIRVESQVDKGSTFYFTLPIHDLGLSESGAATI